MTLKSGIIIAAFVLLGIGGGYLQYQKNAVRCTVEDIERGGSLEMGTKHDFWFDRNTHGEVWLKNGSTYCQIR